jgi:hypothetical protein
MLNKKGTESSPQAARTKKTIEHAAKGEEATEMRNSQECILNGGVYLRHRLKSELSKNLLTLLSRQEYYTPTA